MTGSGTPLRIAFAGFRHDHIHDLYNGVRESADMVIAACCEEDAETRTALAREGRVTVTHTRVTDMLDHVECDAVAVGDYYGARGSIIIEAMKRGRHVIADKPVCTRLAELDEIERLSSGKRLSLGCQLDMRDKGLFIRMRELIRGGVLGSIHAISIGGQHPLLPDTRPHWYFEEGKHGGTINDIAIHAMDLIPWMTGLSVDAVLAARCWNAIAKDYPHFKDAGQFMLRLSNGGGLLGDVSYLMPGPMGYSMEQYWRVTVWGEKGMMETSITADHLLLAITAEQTRQRIAPVPGVKRGYLAAFAREVRGVPAPGDLSTREVIRASRTALEVQQAADQGV